MFPYNLKSYQPASFAPKPTPQPEPIPEAVMRRAKEQGGEYIHKSGKYSVKWWYGKMLTSDAPDFEAWDEYGGEELPAGELVEL